MRNNRKNESFSSAWDSAPTSNSAWGTESAHVEEPVVTTITTTTAAAAVAASATTASYDNSEFIKYRAIYEFNGRNSDEITFQPGDIIMASYSPLVIFRAHLNSKFWCRFQ